MSREKGHQPSEEEIQKTRKTEEMMTEEQKKISRMREAVGDVKKSIIEHNTLEGLAERLTKTREIDLKIKSLIEENQIRAVIETKDGREIKITTAESKRPFIWVDNHGGIHLKCYDNLGIHAIYINIEEISDIRKQL